MLPSRSPEPEAGFDTGAFLASHLTSISKSIRQFVTIKLAPLGLMTGQEQFLLLLLEARTLASIDLANMLAVRPSTVSKMADILEKRGWVVRRFDTDDKRRVLLALTEDGVLMAEKIQSVMRQMEQEFAPFLGDVAGIMSILETIDKGLSKRLSRFR